MNYKLLLPLLVIFQVGCTSTRTANVINTANTNTANKTNVKDSAVRKLLNGTFIVRKTINTPNRLTDSKYYEYYSGLHAKSIGCKSYSEIKLKVGENEKAYKCVANGTFITENSTAIGTPW